MNSKRLMFLIVIAITIIALISDAEGFRKRRIERDRSISYTQYVDCCTSGTLGVAGSTCFKSTINYCAANFGVVQNCITWDGGVDANQTERFTAATAVGPIANLRIVKNPDVNDPFVKKLINDVLKSPVRTKTYTPLYKCLNFADDLEIYLQSIGYDATITILQKYARNDSDGKIYEIDYHAMNDVHLPNGDVIFIEPQYVRYINETGPNGEVVPPEVMFESYLDFNNDTVVSAYTNTPWPRGYVITENVNNKTKPHAKIAVYDSRNMAADNHACTRTTTTTSTTTTI